MENSTKCKRKGVKRDGEICNLSNCSYPKCLQNQYCPECGQTKGVHKISCATLKITIINNGTI
jgi:hypothetical protein